jgi:hypothetical protein
MVRGEPRSPGRNSKRDFHNEKRSNETHASTTDPDARVCRKADARESGLWFMRQSVAISITTCGRCDANPVTGRRNAKTATMLDRRKWDHRIELGTDRHTT